MKRGVLIFALVAIMLTGGTVYFVNRWLQQERQRMTVQTEVKRPVVADVSTFVLVAARDIPAGNFVSAGDLRWQSWPDQAVAAQYVVRNASNANQSEQMLRNFVGTVARQGITVGQPVSREIVVQPGERGFLAAVLKPGMRAVTVRVDEQTGIAGLVFPGDRVDVMLLHRVAGANIGETILTGVRVIAIDQLLNDLKGPARPAGTSGTATNQASATGRAARTITFELTPKQSEIIALATRMGVLTLALQSLACGDGVTEATKDGKDGKDDGKGGVPGTTTGSTSSPSCAEPRRETAATALPDEGNAERGKSFSTEADVTRSSGMRKHAAEGDRVTIIRGTRESVAKTTSANKSDDDGKTEGKKDDGKKPDDKSDEK
jgi:pilus assembly protein CpaB